jgi:two-component system phosphate regulon response regulator PhoB
MSHHILIVDDEQSIREMIQLALTMEGYQCQQAANARDAHAAILDDKPDLVLLDWMMPETSGLELLRRLRKDPVTALLPIIMLTAKTDEAQKIHGLNTGADDYVTKPFSPRELIARIKAVLRRGTESGQEDLIQVNQLKIDVVSQRVYLGDKPVAMGPTEYRLLHFFVTHPERVYTRDQLLDHVWGSNVYVDERTVDVHIRRLRKALDDTPDEAARCSGLVQTVRGSGYRFSDK